MPVTYRIDTVKKLIITTCTGEVRLADVLAHFEELGNDPACAGELDVLLNVSDQVVVPRSAQLSAVGGAISMIRDKVQFRFCAVVARGDAMFGMMRVFEVFAGKYFRAIRVFRHAPEADAWLTNQRAGQEDGHRPDAHGP
jgi:hypothetical protein